MKPKLFLICLLLSSISVTAFAQKANQAVPASKTISFNEVFTRLTVQNNLSVVLTNGTSNKIVIEGDAKAVEVNLADGELQIAARDIFSSRKAIVYVPAAFLTRVNMNSSGSLTSAGLLQNEKMKILLGAEGAINVRSIGNVSIETNDEIQFVKAF